MTSQVSGIVFPPLRHQGKEALRHALEQLERTQWWSPSRLRQAQFRQLEQLLTHAATHSAFYRQRLAGVLHQPLTPQSWQRIPLLGRADIQARGDQLRCTGVPADHGPHHEIKTSGSTGRPVTVLDTAIGPLWWSAITLRDHRWHGRDWSGTLAAIRWRSDRLAMAPDGLQQPDWGAPASIFYKTGPGWLLNSVSDIQAQIQWLMRVDPHYLLTHPSNLRALLDQLSQAGIRPGRLRQVRTVGEVVGDTLRQQTRSLLGVPLIDMYTCQELGYMALQCPDGPHYHVQSEHVYLEVLKNDGTPCQQGETGQVVVTNLHNFAMPLIRYAIGDYARVGGACACGRGLPVLEAISGRSRNLLHRPDGSVAWPDLGFGEFSQVADIRQFQVVQHSIRDIELRLVSPQALSADQCGRIAGILARHLEGDFQIRISQLSHIPASAGGKYEDFLSLL